MKYTILLFIALWAFGAVSIPHPLTVQFKLNQLCMANPDISCQELINYCKRSLEAGHECYYIK